MEANCGTLVLSDPNARSLLLEDASLSFLRKGLKKIKVLLVVLDPSGAQKYCKRDYNKPNYTKNQTIPPNNVIPVT